MKIKPFYAAACGILAALLTAAGIRSAAQTTTQAYAAAAVAQEPSYTIVVDAGHGGEDGGATSVSGVLESQTNLEIAQRTDALLMLLGYRTKMVRDSDTAIYDASATTIREKKISDLRNRVQLVNETPNALLLSIHQNTYSDSRYSGAQVFYGTSDGSRQLAERTQETIRQFLDAENTRKPKPAETVYLMQNVQCTAILVECGFLSNEAEDLKLQSASYQKKLALAFGSALNSWVLEETEDSEI